MTLSQHQKSKQLHQHHLQQLLVLKYYNQYIISCLCVSLGSHFVHIRLKKREKGERKEREGEGERKGVREMGNKLDSRPQPFWLFSHEVQDETLTSDLKTLHLRLVSSFIRLQGHRTKYVKYTRGTFNTEYSNTSLTLNVICRVSDITLTQVLLVCNVAINVMAWQQKYKSIRRGACLFFLIMEEYVFIKKGCDMCTCCVLVLAVCINP